MKRSFHRCFVALGLLAMVMALVAIPAGIALASAKADAVVMAADDMPCHHPCPGCAKPCPDMGTCLLKCFQPLSNVPAQPSVQSFSVRDLIPPGLSRRISEAPIPPLLRPPSV